MQQNEIEALVRTLSESTNGQLSVDDARETVKDFLPGFIEQYVRSPKVPQVKSPKDFHIGLGHTDNRRMAFFLGQAKQKYNLPVDDGYVKHRINDPLEYHAHEGDLLKQIGREKRQNNIKLGAPLERVLSAYTSNDNMKQIKNLYIGKDERIKPKSGATEAQRNNYQKYLDKTKRAERLLNYLNDNNVNMRVAVDNKNPSELAVYLPEYGNTKVTLMSENPQNIGKVNTWRNMISFGRKVDATKYPSETLIDTVLNPNAEIDSVDSLPRKQGGTQYTAIKRKGINDEIFTTSISGGLKSIDDYADQLAQKEAKEKEEQENDEAESNRLDVTDTDKASEITARTTNDFVPITTKQQALKEKQNVGLFSTIYKQGKALGLKDLVVSKNSHGVYKYDYNTVNPKTGRKTPGYGIIGGYIPPEKDGTYKLTYNGEIKGYSVPGMRAYIDTNTGNLTVKRFNSLLREKVRENMLDQVLNPEMRNSVKAYSALDTLYTSDNYSTVIQKGVNSPEYENALIKTLKNRIRLPNEVVESGNAFNEDPDHIRGKQNKKFANKRQEMMETRDIRTIPKEWHNVVDREMTGIGKTMGSSLFIGDDVTINRDGTLTPDPNTKVTKSALHKLPMFQWGKYDPVDRDIMAYNQAIRNVPIRTVNVAMMTMSGYTENDAAVITDKYAQNNKVKDEKTGKMRPLKRGDKITDLHGNKSTISEVINPDEKDPDRRKKLAREIAIVKANPDLDVIVSPYSSISRLNAGSIREMQDRGGIKHLNNPKEFPDMDISKCTMGQESYAVCVGQRVDEKTKIYDEKDFKQGKARNFSHQLAMGMASADLPKTLKYVYSHNINPGWAKFMDDLHVMGYDVDKKHNVGYLDYDSDRVTNLKMPSKEEIEANVHANPRERRELYKTAFKNAMLDAVHEANEKKGPIVMKLPTSYTNAAKQETNKIVIPFEQIKADAVLRKKMGLLDSKSSSVWMNRAKDMYNYAAGIKLDKKPVKMPDGKIMKNKWGRPVYKDAYAPEKPAQIASNLTKQIIDKDFGRKKNVVKSEIYSAPMPDSATAVITPDPKLDIDTVAVGEDLYNNLHLKSPDESVIVWRDPILRDGGFRFMHVVKDKTLTGVAINPVDDKSMDMDHDGDSVAVVPIHDAEVQKELEKMRPSKHLTNPIAKDPESYLETGLELQGSLYAQGDHDAQKDLADPKVTPETVRSIVDKGFNSPKAYGIGIDASSKESYLNSIEDLIKSGAKGKCERDANGKPIEKDGHIKSTALDSVEKYYDGKRTDKDINDYMVGLAVKVDAVGPAGKAQQNLMYALRDTDPSDAMNVTQLLTQTALQAKHNENGEATKNMHYILYQMPNTLRGVKPEAKPNSEYQVSQRNFELNMDKIYNQELGLNVSQESIHRLAEALSDNKGNISSERERRDRNADPIDLAAYSNDSIVTTLNNAIDQDKPIAVGKYTKEFSMPEDLLSDRVLGHYYEKDNQQDHESQAQTENPALNTEQQRETVGPDQNDRQDESYLSDSDQRTDPLDD